MIKVLVLYLDGMCSLVSSSIRLARLYISLPVLHISAGHSLYIPFLLDTWPNTCHDVLKRTQRRLKGKHLFLDQYRLFLDEIPGFIFRRSGLIYRSLPGLFLVHMRVSIYSGFAFRCILVYIESNPVSCI